MNKQRNQKTWGIALLFVAAASAALAMSGCDDDGVTSKCDPMPIVDDNGQAVNENSKWNNPALGEGGALNRWAHAENQTQCVTLPPEGGASN